MSTPPFEGNGRSGNGGHDDGDHDEETEHPVFRDLRALLIWHRTLMLLVAFTAGHWVAIGVAGVTSDRVPEVELLLALLELLTLGGLFFGMSGFVRLAPWSVPMLLVLLIACAFPFTRETDVTLTTVLLGTPLRIGFVLERLKAPALAIDLRLGVEVVPAAMAGWLLFLRPLHRRTATSAPLGAHTLRVKRLGWVAAVVLLALSAFSTGRSLSLLDSGFPVGQGIADANVRALVTTSDVVDTVNCTRPSEQVTGPLFRPLFFVVFIGERADEKGGPFVVAGLRQVDALTGRARVVSGVSDVRPGGDTPPTAAQLCSDFAFSSSVQTVTQLPFPLD